MSRNIVFRTQSCDAQILSNEKTTYNFFNDEYSAQESVSHTDTFDERGALKWFFDSFYIKNILFEELELDQTECEVFLEVVEPITSNDRKPGDIDILIRNNKNPKQSIAIECKKIKAVIDNEGNEKINGIEKAAKRGVSQVNALADMGFYKSYLMLVYLTDGRKNIVHNQMCRGVSGEGITKIYNHPEFYRRREESGVIFLEVVQNTSKNINFNHTVSICCDIDAKPNWEQPSELTEKILKLNHQ